MVLDNKFVAPTPLCGKNKKLFVLLYLPTFSQTICM